ncbi:MAG: DUF5665 domain-containing protein [Clostridiales bacterium]|nr:DUF5665 domain-containing protein [Clostridiales bacterium]
MIKSEELLPSQTSNQEPEQRLTCEANPEPDTEPSLLGLKEAGFAINHSDIERLTDFADYLTRLNLADYIKLTQKPARMMWISFISGVARGFGIAVGFTLLSALGIYILHQLRVLDLPLIGNLIAQILDYVEMARQIRI